LKLGDIRIRTLSGGAFRLDGGSMFGVVPKLLWQQKAPADAQNRIQLATNCLLIETPDQRILVDTGYGSKLNEKRREQIDAESGDPLLHSLRSAGIEPAEIDVVIFSHLHFDHSGGATRFADQDQPLSKRPTLIPVFPNARHIVQQDEWEDATSDLPELAGTYEIEQLLVLQEHGLLELVQGDQQITDHVSVQQTGGHTRGHQIIKLDSQGEQATYLGDICPTAAHLKIFWTMAYDQFPTDVRRIKLKLFQSMIDAHGWLLFDHDPQIHAARLRQNDRSQTEIASAVRMEAFE
jgi:glyoxylase-like metal-dependent hydrolase (beta-lactamase superfamily II)